MSAQDNKRLVRRLVDEAVEKRWVSPFRSAFPDFEMEVVDLIAKGDRVVAHFRCSGTHRGEWLGVPGTERRFVGVDEIYIFRVQDGKLVSALGVEDNLSRLRELGIAFRADEES
jgi:predicted ester cyclase